VMCHSKPKLAIHNHAQSIAKYQIGANGLFALFRVEEVNKPEHERLL